ncbi:holin [Staphylococcus arlettae]|uniref:LrgB family protein n=1 Tax=Staphylococcus arlettae TaxID=29378 RepID=UPI000D1B8BAE|nr:LrgB family protein [Staphylococcus arlettae]PTH42694.1 holin [Staphylococcus arlettae]
MVVLKAIFMILLTVLTYIISRKLQIKYKNPLLNPSLISAILIITILVLLNLDYSDYMSGGKWINYMLNCTVVALALPLYKYWETIKRHAKVIFTSVLVSTLINFFLIYLTLKVFGYSKEIIVTLLPKSITAAVGLQVSHQLGGIDAIAVMFITFTGIIGSMFGEYLLNMVKFKNSIARGLFYGNSAHGFGTAKAFETDIEDGTFSSIGMILTAIFSSILIPIFILILY